MTKHDNSAGVPAVHAPNRRPGPRLSSPPSGEARAQPRFSRQPQIGVRAGFGGSTFSPPVAAAARVRVPDRVRDDDMDPGSRSGVTKEGCLKRRANLRSREGGHDKNMTIHDIPAGVPLNSLRTGFRYAAGAATRDGGSVVRQPALNLPKRAAPPSPRRVGQGQRAPRGKVTASKGGRDTGSFPRAAPAGVHSPFPSANASRVRADGSTSQRWQTPSRA